MNDIQLVLRNNNRFWVKNNNRFWLKKKKIWNIYIYSSQYLDLYSYTNLTHFYKKTNITKLKPRGNEISIIDDATYDDLLIFFIHSPSYYLYYFKNLLKIFFCLFENLKDSIQHERSLIYLYVLLNQGLFYQNSFIQLFLKTHLQTLMPNKNSTINEHSDFIDISDIEFNSSENNFETKILIEDKTNFQVLMRDFFNDYFKEFIYEKNLQENDQIDFITNEIVYELQFITNSTSFNKLLTLLMVFQEVQIDTFLSRTPNQAHNIDLVISQLKTNTLFLSSILIASNFNTKTSFNNNNFFFFYQLLTYKYQNIRFVMQFKSFSVLFGNVFAFIYSHFLKQPHIPNISVFDFSLNFTFLLWSRNALYFLEFLNNIVFSGEKRPQVILLNLLYSFKTTTFLFNVKPFRIAGFYIKLEGKLAGYPGDSSKRVIIKYGQVSCSTKKNKSFIHFKSLITFNGIIGATIILCTY